MLFSLIEAFRNTLLTEQGVAYGNPGEEELNETQLEERSKLRAEMKQEAKSSAGISGGGGRAGLSGNSAQKKRKHK